MESEIQTNIIEYRKPGDEVYHIQRRAPIPPVRHISLWLLVPFLLTLVLGAYLVFSSVSLESANQTEYAVSGEAKYQVYLKENNYYSEKYLGPGRQYIASLIDTVRLEYNYALEANIQIDANYEYEIIATAMATDKNNKTQVLYEQSDTLKTGAITPVEGGEIRINDNVNIDYKKYNEYMRGFRTDFGIAANCYMMVSLIVKVNGAIQTEDILAVNIPLSDQTLNISIDAEAINRVEKAGEERTEMRVNNMSISIVGSTMALASLIAIGLVVYLYATRFGDNWYAEAEYQIKKKYDTLVVDATSSYHEDGNVVRVGDFLELTDACRAEGGPITRYDVDPEYKSYYVVGSSNGLKTYRYTLSRAYQDELRETGQGKERF